MSGRIGSDSGLTDGFAPVQLFAMYSPTQTRGLRSNSASQSPKVICTDNRRLRPLDAWRIPLYREHVDLKLATRILAALGFFSAMLTATSAHAELSAEDLAKIAQNPVGNLISVPFQENAYFNVGPLNGTQNVLNIQPVIPISLNDDWNIITRTILPIISLPAFIPGGEHQRHRRSTNIRLSLARAAGRMDLGRRCRHPVAYSQQQPPRQQQRGSRTYRRRLAPRAWQPLGLRGARQQCLVRRQQSHLEQRTEVQQRVDTAVRQLQLPQRCLSHDLTHHHRQLGSQGFASVDRTDGRRRGSAVQDR